MMAASLNTLNEQQCLVIWAQTLGLEAGPWGLNELQILKIIAGSYSSNQPLNGKNELDCLKIIASGVSANGYPYNGLNEFQCLVVIAKALGLEPNFPGGNELDALRLIAANANPPVAPPVNTALPTIDNTSPREGDTINGSDGTWTGSPTFGYQWLVGGSPVGGATTNSYVVQNADVGSIIAFKVTGTNAGGSADAISDPTNAVIPFSPVNTIQPQVTGNPSPSPGDTLNCDTGTWINSPTSYDYQWRTGGSRIPILGATSSSYTIQPGDSGNTLLCTVTAHNAGGDGDADSTESGVVN
jgi:hypothetical protein